MEINVLLLLPLGFAAATAPPLPAITAEREMLVIDAPDDFRVGNRARNAVVELQEIIQPPETVDSWTKLITNMIFFGISQSMTPAEFYEKWAKSLLDRCAGSTETHEAGTVDGMPALRAWISCPLLPQTAKPERLVAVIVQGYANIMMTQVAFRHAQHSADMRLVDHVIKSMKVCDSLAFAACVTRPATGFLPGKPH